MPFGDGALDASHASDTLDASGWVRWTRVTRLVGNILELLVYLGRIGAKRWVEGVFCVRRQTVAWILRTGILIT